MVKRKKIKKKVVRKRKPKKKDKTSKVRKLMLLAKHKLRKR
tara:strand:+ start:2503 stop:2625 length:123 start_codon:yes stop_codon:yes gene_type:complete